MHLARAYIYLGREWLYNMGPTLCHSYQDNSLEFMHDGRLERLQGEPSILAAPLIFSSIELCQVYDDDDIEQVYVVTPLHTFVSSDEICVFYNIFVDETICLNNVFADETNFLNNVSVVETRNENNVSVDETENVNPCFEKPSLHARKQLKAKNEIEAIKTQKYATILSSLL